MEEIDAINITQQDLFEFFNEQFQVTCVFITGFINDAIIQKLLSSFETVNYRLHNTSQVSNELEIHALGSLYIEKRESVQTSLRIGHRIITRTHEDYPSFILLNHILGGYFGSRLMKNIREEKGLTYGIYSSIHNFQHDAYFVIGADVNKKNKEIAINEIKNELLSLSNVPIQLNELNTAKNHLLGSLQLEVANPFAVIEKLKTIQLNNLANNFYSDLFDKIRNVSAITIQKTANKYFSDKFIEISVG
jgi:predicted Zn-dependent peptidase